LSSLSGLARETVTRVLTKLEKKGLILRNQQTLFLPDLQALERRLAHTAFIAIYKDYPQGRT